MTTVKLTEEWKTTKYSLALLEQGLEKVQSLEDKGLLEDKEEELTRIARDLEKAINCIVSNLHYDAQSHCPSVGVDHTHTIEGLKEYLDEFGG